MEMENSLSESQDDLDLDSSSRLVSNSKTILETGRVSPTHRRSSGTAIHDAGSDTTSGGSSRSSFASGIMRFLLMFVKDIATFLVRGGVSSLMFLMDEVLSLFLAAVSWIPGFVYIGYAVRGAKWLFQVLMWVVYTVIELAFYLPTTMLVLYLILLGVAYIFMPAVFDPILSFMFWLSHTFLHLMKYLLR